MSFHSGFVCILGRPNAGKSTLLNALVGEKLAIISPKRRLHATVSWGSSTLPAEGKIRGSGNPLGHARRSPARQFSRRKMMAEVREALEGCNLILLIDDAARRRDSPTNS